MSSTSVEGSRSRGRAVCVLAVLMLTLLLGGVGAANPSVGAGPGERARAVRVVTFPGYGVTVQRASGQLGRLDRTSPGFRRAVSTALDRLWRQAGARPRCAQAPSITVKRWRSDGWARIDNIGLFAPCPSGGWWEIWRTHGSIRKVVLAGQDQPSCAQLRRRHVPAGIWDACYDASGYLTPYRGRA